MRTIPLLIFFVITFSLLGQKPPEKFGDIPMEDMKMTVYPADSSAAAVVLFDYGRSFFNVPQDGSYQSVYKNETLQQRTDGRRAIVDRGRAPIRFEFERHVRIKILKKEALGRANIRIAISGSQRLNELRAATYNLENGKIVQTKMSNDGIFFENLTTNVTLVTFTLPNVKEGSVIEYVYKPNSTLSLSWTFQGTIPTRRSEYWMIVPDYLSFERKMQGFISLSEYEEKGEAYLGQNAKKHHFVCNDVPAFKDEPFMTTDDDYISKIIFSIASIANQEAVASWEKLNTRLLENENFGVTLTKTDFLKEETEKVIAGLTEAPQKISRISDYVKKNYEWDKAKGYFPSTLKKIMEKKKGNSADLNFMLASMLIQAGFKVDMVLVSTRDHGLIRKFSPMPSQFNYVICSIRTPDRTYLLDATEKYLPYDALPARCLNGEGLVISAVNFGWIEIPAKTKEKTIIGADLSLTDAGVLQGKVAYSYDGYDALKFRKDYFEKGEEEYVKQFAGSKQWALNSKEFVDVNETDKLAKANYQISIKEHATNQGDVIYLNPFIANQMTDNPFKSAMRLYPIDYGNKIEKVYNCKITIPEGFEIDEVPQSKVIGLPENGGRFTYNVVRLNNAINITSNFQINKTLFVPEEYQHLQEFYNQVIAKQAEQIVLKKK
ncbi:MAG TPA: DUF3857 domain-containing protein [Cyclobacteriaceae bacterium]|nr:DUF3857 domain-containing protein [Cyclobacteriaceae bacterium]